MTFDVVPTTKPHFTSDQQKAIDGIISFIAAPFNPANYIVGLIGAGGTGKTFSVKYIIEHCKYPFSMIKCASPTHKACRVLAASIKVKEAYTIQSTFGLRLNMKLEDFDPVHPQFDPMAKTKLDNVKLLIIDEASMIPAKLVTFICDECRNKEIKIIFVGDKYQLFPVKEKASIAFDRCAKLYELREIVRQASSNPITELLQLLRGDIENKTYNFLTYVHNHVGDMNYNDNGEGYSICTPNNFRNLINNSFTNKEYTKNIDMYRVITYTNPAVNAWNKYIRNFIIKDSEKGIINKNDLIMSYETIVDDFLDTVINNSEEYIINSIVDFVDNHYAFKGFLVKFQLVHGGTITQPLFIVDVNDAYTKQRYYKVVTELINTARNSTGGTRVSHWKAYYEFKKKYLLPDNIEFNNKIIYTRDIDYGFAITAHKSQGSTYDNVFVDVNNMVYNSKGIFYTDYNEILRRLYVGCSRAHKELILCYGQ